MSPCLDLNSCSYIYYHNEKIYVNSQSHTTIYYSVEGGNRQNGLYLESRTSSWAKLWTLNDMPSIYGNVIPTGKPGPRKEETQGSLLPKRIP